MRVIITGASGMVGEGVLLTCLEHPAVTEVLSVGRKQSNRSHPKLQELILKDFSEIARHTEQLKKYDGCFFCAGVSSVGESEATFTKKTFDFVVPFAKILADVAPEQVFIYVSGAGTDSSETGNMMWARVKGKTENAVARLPFKAVYNFRPAMMKPVKGQKNVKTIFRVLLALYPVWNALLPKWSCTLDQVGLAMIHCVSRGYNKTILEVPDIKKQAVV